MVAYRLPNFELKSFFEQISSSLSPVVNQYVNIIVTGELNMNLLDLISDAKKYFFDLRDIFALANLGKEKSRFKNKNGTLLDFIITRKRHCFQKTVIREASLNDCHKSVTTIFKSTFKKLSPKK